MRVLIGYDGTPCADAALEDLQRAGLPEHGEALILTVADVILPPDPATSGGPALPGAIADAIERSYADARRQIEEARRLAETGAAKLREMFPGWNASAKAVADSPAWGIVKMCHEWRPALAVVGAHGQSITTRLILGSVSQRVVTAAPCAVRVVHKPPRTRGATRILIGLDGSECSEKAVDAVAARRWERRATVHLVTVTTPRLTAAMARVESTTRRWLDAADTEEYQWVERFAQTASRKLAGQGLKVTHIRLQGNPKRELVEEARRRKADCIFVGARGLSGIKHQVIGSVSAAVTARAHCTVEVVRG